MNKIVKITLVLMLETGQDTDMVMDMDMVEEN